MPRTGVLDSFARARTLARSRSVSCGAFSAAEMVLAIEPKSRFKTPSTSPFSDAPVAKSLFATKSLIMPCSPIARPSSGE